MKYPFTLLFFVTIVFGCKKPPEQTQPIQESITESVYASGIVKSRNQYQVFASANGIIKQIFVAEGDTVKKGDAILQLRDVTARLNTENARIAAEYGSLAANNDKLKQQELDIDLAYTRMQNDASLLQRQRELWKQGIGSQNDLDQRELAYKNDAGAYNAAKLQLEDLQKKLSLQEKQSRNNLALSATIAGDFTVRSELDGRVYRLLKEKGEMVTTQTAVAVVGDATGFMLELQVDEYDITRVKPGLKVLLNMDSYKGQVFEAVVTRINPIMNEQSKSFTVEADFVTPPPTLYPNLTTEANIVLQVKENALTIPRSFLTGEGFVLMKNNEKRKVSVGLKDYQKVEIVSGLTAGEIILKPAP